MTDDPNIAQSPGDAWSRTAEHLRGELSCGSRIGLAIALLESFPESVSDEFRNEDRINTLRRVVRTRFPRATGTRRQARQVDLSETIRNVLNWVLEPPNRPPEMLLAALLELDIRLGSQCAGLLHQFPARVELPEFLGLGTMWVWVNPPDSPFNDVRERLLTPRLRAADGYTWGLAHCLRVIRHGRSRAGAPRVRLIALDPDVVECHRRRWQHGLPEGLRLASFSVRGTFRVCWEYSGPRTDGRHGYWCSGVAPEHSSSYEERLRAIVRAAANPAQGAHVLALPELSVDTHGLEVVSSELRAAAKDKHLRPPMLTFAGTCHIAVPGAGSAGATAFWNRCTVLDHTGRTLWTQDKRVPYPPDDLETQGLLHQFRDKCHAHGRGKLFVEDIHRATDVVVVPTVIGTFAVAICSDVVPCDASAVASLLLDLPVDWVVIPSRSPNTRLFVDRATDFARHRTATLFANAGEVVPEGETSRRPPASINAEQSLRERLAGFVNVPDQVPTGIWFDRPTAPPRERGDAAWVAIEDEGAWEGLVVELIGRSGPSEP